MTVLQVTGRGVKCVTVLQVTWGSCSTWQGSKLCDCVAGNVGELFHMAGEVGQAVGSLVTVMTDEDGGAGEEERR